MRMITFPSPIVSCSPYFHSRNFLLDSRWRTCRWTPRQFFVVISGPRNGQTGHQLAPLSRPSNMYDLRTPKLRLFGDFQPETAKYLARWHLIDPPNPPPPPKPPPRHRSETLRSFLEEVSEGLPDLVHETAERRCRALQQLEDTLGASATSLRETPEVKVDVDPTFAKAQTEVASCETNAFDSCVYLCFAMLMIRYFDTLYIPIPSTT